MQLKKSANNVKGGTSKADKVITKDSYQNDDVMLGYNFNKQAEDYLLKNFATLFQTNFNFLSFLF